LNENYCFTFLNCEFTFNELLTWYTFT